MRIFLSGPMGAGKTTAGRALASALGLRFVDLDEAIEARHGAIESIFAQRGEGGFRALEGELVRELIGEENLCLALGGGTVCVYETRKLLLQSGLLFTLVADVRTLSERVVRDQSDVEKTARPLLAGGDVASRLRTLLRERTDAYGECHASIDASAGTETVVRQLLARVQDRTIGVFLGRRSYSVDIGWGIRERRSEGFEVADQNTARYARRPHLLDAGEAHKELSAVEAIWDAALARGVDRAGRLIAMGGGVVGDLT
ncbi:MAG: shikimate kinase, partial [Myxococcota bacterium]